MPERKAGSWPTFRAHRCRARCATWVFVSRKDGMEAQADMAPEMKRREERRLTDKVHRAAAACHTVASAPLSKYCCAHFRSLKNRFLAWVFQHPAWAVRQGPVGPRLLQSF